MLPWVKSYKRSAALVGLTLLLPTYLFLSSLSAILGARSNYVEEIDFLEPRIARLIGLAEAEGQLQDGLAKVSTIIADHYYPKSSDPAAVAASLQSDARRLLVESGLEVTNSQVLPVRKREGFDYVAVKLVARGGLDALDQSLNELAAYRPVILVESLDVIPNRRGRTQTLESQSINTSMQLLSLRVAQ